jgi:uncharacterized protein (DUF924 family)
MAGSFEMTLNEILHYWYSERVKKQWFSATPELDAEIHRKYANLWKDAADGQLDHWMDSAEGCLALNIILDQFPLNMFRGQAKSFTTEAKAIRVTKHALNQSFDKQIAIERLPFLLMPLMHSEDLADQKLSVTLFKEATNRSESMQDNLRFAEHHYSIIEKYHRFPHRNAILGRQNTPEESAYLTSKHAFKG